MRLIEFTPENCVSEKGGRRSLHATPAISITKAGAFILTRAAVALLGIKEGDHLSINQDEDDLEVFYIVNNGPGKGFAVTEKKNRSVVFFSSPLATKMREAIYGKAGKYTFKTRISGQPTDIDGRKFFGLLPCPIV